MITIFLNWKRFSNPNQIKKLLKWIGFPTSRDFVKTNYFLDKTQNVLRRIGSLHTQKLYHHQSKKPESVLK